MKFAPGPDDALTTHTGTMNGSNIHESHGGYTVQTTYTVTSGEGGEASSPIERHSTHLSPYNLDSDAVSVRSSRSELDQFPDQDSVSQLKKKVSV